VWVDARDSLPHCAKIFVRKREREEEKGSQLSDFTFLPYACVCRPAELHQLESSVRTVRFTLSPTATHFALSQISSPPPSATSPAPASATKPDPIKSVLSSQLKEILQRSKDAKKAAANVRLNQRATYLQVMVDPVREETKEHARCTHFALHRKLQSAKRLTIQLRSQKCLAWNEEKYITSLYFRSCFLSNSSNVAR
jgi:hypothetical protein